MVSYRYQKRYKKLFFWWIKIKIFAPKFEKNSLRQIDKKNVKQRHRSLYLSLSASSPKNWAVKTSDTRLSRNLCAFTSPAGRNNNIHRKKYRLLLLDRRHPLVPAAGSYDLVKKFSRKLSCQCTYRYVRYRYSFYFCIPTIFICSHPNTNHI